MNSSGNQTKHVVLADDDQDHGLLFGRILHQVDPSLRLTVATDGAALMDLLSLQLPDLLFLDLDMPCKDGMECLSDIRRSDKTRQLPVVVYSSSSQLSDIRRSYACQADLYMVKPFHSLHLRHALES